MKKRILVVSVALAFLLTAFAPPVALAHGKKKNFRTEGEITGLTEGTVYPLGSIWWRVVEREVYGSMSGDITGDFVITYEGMFQMTQVGIFKGMLVVMDMDGESYGFELTGKTEPAELTGEFYWNEELETWCPIFRMTFKGQWGLLRGAKGQGTFEAWADVRLSECVGGHVQEIVASSFTMRGRYCPDTH